MDNLSAFTHLIIHIIAIVVNGSTSIICKLYSVISLITSIFPIVLTVSPLPLSLYFCLNVSAIPPPSSSVSASHPPSLSLSIRLFLNETYSKPSPTINTPEYRNLSVIYLSLTRFPLPFCLCPFPLCPSSFTLPV